MTNEALSIYRIYQRTLTEVTTALATALTSNSPREAQEYCTSARTSLTAFEDRLPPYLQRPYSSSIRRLRKNIRAAERAVKQRIGVRR